MDAVELARQVAGNLHVQAVANGFDPWQPYEFAVAEAQRRGLDVERTAVDAAVLNNARATFVANDRLILHENAGTLFEQAFLVVHEIGHAELGDDSDEPTLEIDPTRSAEPSPVGIDRVVDYGRRQRREVQMDLFAREFLLPRAVARRLHLEDGLSASQIAERLGAPFDVVAQQLLDALLLPPVATHNPDHIERTLNDEQIEAAKHRGCAYLLEAGPGTGKTQTLAARVEGLLSEGIDPRRILLLTFSNKAAGEMADRIARKHKDAAAAMWIETFHGFGLDVIRRFHLELGLPKDPRMMDRTEAAELIEQEFPRLGLTHYRDLYDPTQVIADILGAISRAKDEVVSPEGYAHFVEQMRERAKSPEEREGAEKALEVARVYAAYEELKTKALCVDFGDLVSLPVRLLEGNAEIRTHFQQLYDHVLVDEYQDVNRSSIRLLSALRGSGKNLWAVGDAKQSIYRFRGASSFNMDRFGNEDFPGGIRGQLKLNYRSVSEVVNAFSTFAIEMKAGRNKSGLQGTRGASGSAPQLITVAQAEQQTVAVAESIAAMHSAGHGYRDQAVLCTGNERLSILAHDLEQLGVPVLFLGSLFERPEVKDLCALLTILTDRRASALVRIACWPDFSMSMMDAVAVLDHLREHPGKGGDWLSDTNSIENVSAQGRAALAKLAAALCGFDQRSSPWTVLATTLLDRTRIAAMIATSEGVLSRTRGIAIWQLMNFVRVQPAARGLPIVRLLDRVRRLLRLGDDRDLRQLPVAAQSLDAVRLMTIHGAKGLEFPVVHMPGLNADTIPRSLPTPPCPPPDGMVAGGTGSALEVLRATHFEEQECLFYVALSRARDRLFIYASTKKANGQNRPLSPFLQRLGSGLERRSITPKEVLSSPPGASVIDLVVEGEMRCHASQLSMYETCPRRFLYTYVLQIGGRRTATGFMQMHEAVRTVFQSVIAGTPIANENELQQRVADAFSAHGVADYGYVNEYKTLAVAMVRYFLSTRQNHTGKAPSALSLTFGDEHIIVQPDDVLLRADGGYTLRRVRTGHQRSYEAKDVAAAAFVLAAQQAFPDAAVELVSLADQRTTRLELSPKELQNRRDKLAGFLKNVRLGRFPAFPSARMCPRCPAFFVCGQVPSGILRKKFG